MSAATARRNLALADANRRQAARERSALIGAPSATVEAALLNPTEALGTKRLSTLFATTSGKRKGLIPQVGPKRLRRALVKVAATTPHRRLLWGEDLRLGDLSAQERRLLIEALVAQSPRWWREGN